MAFSATFVLLLMVYQYSITSIECKKFSLENLLRTGKADPEWSFSGDKGPDKWVKLGYKNCKGKRQSPVNLYSKFSNFTYMDAVKYSEGCYKNRSDFEVKNVGKFVTMTLPKNKPYIESGGLSITEKYYFDGVVFQWKSSGSSEKRGHRWAKCWNPDTVQNCDFEILMFFTNKPGTKHVALGACFKATKDKNDYRLNKALEPMEDWLDNIKHKGEITSLDKAVSLSSLFKDGLNDNNILFVYDGSLPFPPCDQNTQYYFFRFDEYCILQKTLNKFRGVYRNTEDEKDEPMSDNYRPTQEWDNDTRKLYERSPHPGFTIYGCPTNG